MWSMVRTSTRTHPLRRAGSPTTKQIGSGAARPNQRMCFCRRPSAGWKRYRTSFGHWNWRGNLRAWQISLPPTGTTPEIAARSSTRFCTINAVGGAVFQAKSWTTSSNFACTLHDYIPSLIGRLVLTRIVIVRVGSRQPRSANASRNGAEADFVHCGLHPPSIRGGLSLPLLAGPLRVSRRYRWHAGVRIGHAMPTGPRCIAFACSGTARTAYGHHRPREEWSERARHVAAPRALGAGWWWAAARLQPARR